MAERGMKLVAAQYNVTVSSTALHLIDSPFTFTAAQLDQADAMVFQVHAEAVRRRLDGNAPTTTVGLVFDTSQPFQIWRGNALIQAWESIRDGAADATVSVELYARE